MQIGYSAIPSRKSELWYWKKKLKKEKEKEESSNQESQLYHYEIMPCNQKIQPYH